MKNKITVYVMDYGRDKFLLQWKDPVTGKRKSQTSQFSTKAKATKEAGQLEESLNNRLPTGTGSIAWGHFVEEYTEKHLQSLKKTSQDRAEGVLSVFEAKASPRFLRNVTGSVLSSYCATLRANGLSEATIATHMRTLRAALQWALDAGHIKEIPPIPKIARARKKRAKGRPLTDAEFYKFVGAIQDVPSISLKARESWCRLLIGIWYSGLRLGEALALTWGKVGRHETALWIDMTGEFPLMGIVAESEKGFEDRLLPLTPDFGRWLLRVPEEKRHGWVFPITKHRYPDVRNIRSVSKVITQIGAASGITVNSQGKFASAHDLRRSFGLRWSHKSFPAEHKELMRHASIQTTEDYYALHEATSFAKRLWAADAADRTTKRTTAQNLSDDDKKKNP
ncbi:tyrosine-type recombinase/integrase [Schlesneria sp. T3-172]|uniref:tyrosine-type recombinase/integrase n=1 Tax=Schlesneria sphaerica TaxID=3373610 RepID=UPI0037CBC987